MNDTADAPAEIPLPTHEQLYSKLTNWVEKGVAPEQFDAKYQGKGSERTFPLCIYPQKAVFKDGNPLNSDSYMCQ
jgi:hypothetical protein